MEKTNSYSYLKEIKIGEFIKKRVSECDIDAQRICKSLKIDEKELEDIYNSSKVSTEILLGFSKLLDYDFFRLYSQHLILYAPASIIGEEKQPQKSSLPSFRKNIYTKEIIDFVLELIHSQTKTKNQIIEEYRIPKTTLYKWISKYGNS